MSSTSSTTRSNTKVALGLAIAGLVAVFSGGLLLVTAGTAASTSATTYEPCVPSAAWTETVEHPEVSHMETVVVVDKEAWTETIPAVPSQHYSWNGGRLDVDNPPVVLPDDTDPDNPWQKNTTNEPHEGPGNPATWVNDSLHYTANSQGFASWFYYRHAVAEQVIEHPTLTHEEQVKVVDQAAWTETVEHPAVVCETTTPPTTPAPEVEPTTATATPSPEVEQTTSPVPESPESESPEVLGVQESQPPNPQTQEVPTSVDAGYAGRSTGEDWGALLVVGGLLLLTSSGAAAAATRRV